MPSPAFLPTCLPACLLSIMFLLLSVRENEREGLSIYTVNVIIIL